MRAPRIDAHQHYWQVSRGDYAWLTPELKAIYRDFGPHDLSASLDRADIAATVLVQAAPTDAETDYLLELAGGSDSRVAGVVGWTALGAPGSVRRIESLACNPLLKGVRPMLQDIADPQWVLRPEHAAAFQALIRRDLAFDALVKTEHLSSVLTLARRYPELRMVIDHAAKPTSGDDAFGQWAEGMRSIATQTTCSCKLSGLTTAAGPGWTLSGLQRYVDHLIDTFGPARLLWGSDWPVVNLASSFDQWLHASSALLRALADAERRAIFGGNAYEFYRLGAPTTHHVK